MDNPDHFHQLGNRDQFLCIYVLRSCASAVLDLLNSLQYGPQFIVVHVEALDFSKYNNLQQHQNIKTMMQKVNKLVKAVNIHHSDGFKRDLLFPYGFCSVVPGLAAAKSHQESLGKTQWGLGKKCQISRSLHHWECGIQAQKGQGLYNPQDLVNLFSVGNHMFMVDVLIKVKKVLLPFHTVYKASQVYKALHKACQIQAKELKCHMKNLPLN